MHSDQEYLPVVGATVAGLPKEQESGPRELPPGAHHCQP